MVRTWRGGVRWWVIALAVVLLLTLGHGAALAASSSTGSLASASTPAPTPTLSGCQVCAQNGDCSHAYLDGPGQFCGNWLDQLSQRQRCCCPQDATCKVSNYACNCSRTNASTRGGPDKTAVPLWASVLITVASLFAVAGLVACCCWCCCRQRPEPRLEGLVYGAPPGVSGYGAPSGAYYAHGHNYDGGSTALGVGAGVLGGMLVGAAIADAGDSGFDGGYDGGGGGYDGGGGDGGGDFGGDF